MSLQGWYDSYQHKHVATPQAVMEASVEVELHKILQLTPGATLSDVRCDAPLPCQVFKEIISLGSEMPPYHMLVAILEHPLQYAAL